MAILMLLAFGFFASQIKFEEDITKLIPTNDKADVTAKVLKQLNFADKITVILKLDKNFHIYIHGNKDLIEKGFDDNKSLNYYKVYFREEQ